MDISRNLALRLQRLLAGNAISNWRHLISHHHHNIKSHDQSNTLPHLTLKTNSTFGSTALAPISNIHPSSSGQTDASITSQSSVIIPASAFIQQSDRNSKIPEQTTTSKTPIGSRSNSPGRSELFILFCTFQGLQLRHSQIEVAKCESDDIFFETLRLEYRRMRGFWRYWLDPQQFGHCEFVKFTRFYIGELATVGRDLPQSIHYEYRPKPPGPHDDPPITPHEFRTSFYRLRNTCGRKDALTRIPKRVKRFQVNLHVDGIEHMWGCKPNSGLHLPSSPFGKSLSLQAVVRSWPGG